MVKEDTFPFGILPGSVSSVWCLLQLH